MKANWITASGNPDVFPAEVAGRRFMVLTIGAAAVALAGCHAMDVESDQSADNAVQATEYYQDRDAGVCYADVSSSVVQRTAVDCTPLVMAKIAAREAKYQ